MENIDGRTMGTLVKRFLKATLAAVLAPAIVHAAMDADLCRVAKMKAGSAYHGCRCKAQATHVKSAGAPADDSKRDAAYLACDTALVGAYGAAESRYGSACPTSGDVDSVLADLSRCTGSGFFSSRLLNIAQRTPYGPGSDGDFQIGASRSLTDGGDGTVTDNRTGLMWEKKSWDGSIHDMGNAYSWGGGYLDGTVRAARLPRNRAFMAAITPGRGAAHPLAPRSSDRGAAAEARPCAA